MEKPPEVLRERQRQALAERRLHPEVRNEEIAYPCHDWDRFEMEETCAITNSHFLKEWDEDAYAAPFFKKCEEYARAELQSGGYSHFSRGPAPHNTAAQTYMFNYKLEERGVPLYFEKLEKQLDEALKKDGGNAQTPDAIKKLLEPFMEVLDPTYRAYVQGYTWHWSTRAERYEEEAGVVDGLGMTAVVRNEYWRLDSSITMGYTGLEIPEWLGLCAEVKKYRMKLARITAEHPQYKVMMADVKNQEILDYAYQKWMNYAGVEIGLFEKIDPWIDVQLDMNNSLKRLTAMAKPLLDKLELEEAKRIQKLADEEARALKEQSRRDREQSVRDYMTAVAKNKAIQEAKRIQNLADEEARRVDREAKRIQNMLDEEAKAKEKAAKKEAAAAQILADEEAKAKEKAAKKEAADVLEATKSRMKQLRLQEMELRVQGKAERERKKREREDRTRDIQLSLRHDIAEAERRLQFAFTTKAKTTGQRKLTQLRLELAEANRVLPIRPSVFDEDNLPHCEFPTPNTDA